MQKILRIFHKWNSIIFLKICEKIPTLNLELEGDGVASVLIGGNADVLAPVAVAGVEDGELGDGAAARASGAGRRVQFRLLDREPRVERRIDGDAAQLPRDVHRIVALRLALEVHARALAHRFTLGLRLEARRSYTYTHKRSLYVTKNRL